MSPNAKLKWRLALVGIPISVLVPGSFAMFWTTYFLQRMNWRKRNSLQPIALVHALSLVVSICLQVVGDSGGTGFSYGEAVSNRALPFFFAQASLLYIDLYVAKNIGAGLTTSVTRFTPTQRVLNKQFFTAQRLLNRQFFTTQV